MKLGCWRTGGRRNGPSTAWRVSIAAKIPYVSIRKMRLRETERTGMKYIHVMF